MILSCVRRIYDRVGSYGDISLLSRTLRGSRDRSVLEKGLDDLSTYGLMRDKTRTEVYDLISHLEAESCLLEQENKGLALTDKARDVLYRGNQVFMLTEVNSKENKPEVRISMKDAELYEVLLELREKLARKEKLWPDAVFTDRDLIDMANKKPKTMYEFRKVSGVGEIKAAWYGKAFVEKIREFIREND